MLHRWWDSLLSDDAFGQKMRLLGGPRQCGKTTLAKEILAAHGSDQLYYNWDIPEVRKRYRQNSFFYRQDLRNRKNQWICFDEIHKSREWKNILKGIYDSDGDRLTVLVTGSARLVLLRRAGDSLAGRYFLFHLPPVLTGELAGHLSPEIPMDAGTWFDQKAAASEQKTREIRKGMDQIWEFGPFPEPLLKGNRRFARLWRRSYIDAVVRGDMRDMTRIRDLELAERLMEMLPSRIGTPFSTNAVREDLEVSFATVRGILQHFERLYITFSLPPYTWKINRPVKKERKVYLFEWSAVEDTGSRFENFVALELLALTHFWTETSGEEFALSFVRNREGKETDFLILRNSKPWCLLECKSRQSRIESHHLRFARQLGDIPFIQITRQQDVLRVQGRAMEISADRFLAG